ncbi:hypothetical protein Q7C36_012170 [Tachysurus vachellii]|uniref:Dual specificity protein phosphatase n=1 Tax=Tachysurus vachellii TaxID=175792 RepID=A0AA88MQL3_TACVA|nr:hypothetical protein Q7C36_012170 [Tachysurus vachellii]
MSYRSKYNDSSSAKTEIDFTSPALAVMGVEQLLFAAGAINSPANEVWPRLYIGDMKFAENREELRRQNFTHVLNCAHNFRRSNDFYSGTGITYLGIEARDSPAYNISIHFNTGTEFIHNALRTGGKILVHCHVGVSRSATIVLAYLMLKHSMNLVEAVKHVKQGRMIIPNRGFLRQLIELHVKLYGYRS